jgi:hypothetical protein
MPEPVREIEVEVLPPDPASDVRAGAPPQAGPTIYTRAADGSREPKFNDPFIALVSRLMDNAFVIPGTNIRFGLDPLIGLLPGIGDSATALTSLMLFLQSTKYGIPKIVMVRMAINVILNTTIGALPVVGDAFSFWFKSNQRNYDLLCKHAAAPGTSTKSDWLFISALAGGLFLVLAATFIAYAAVAATVVRFLIGR